jgi:hypothetical protein
MNAGEFGEKTREMLNKIFNDTEVNVNVTREILKEVVRDLDEIAGEAEVMIDALPD